MRDYKIVCKADNPRDYNSTVKTQASKAMQWG